MPTYLSRNQTSLTRTLETHSLALSLRKLYSGFVPPPFSPNHHHGSQDFAGARGPVTSPSFLDHFFQPSVLCPNSSEPTPGPVWPFSRVHSPKVAHMMYVLLGQQRGWEAAIWKGVENKLSYGLGCSSSCSQAPTCKNRAEDGRRSRAGHRPVWGLALLTAVTVSSGLHSHLNNGLPVVFYICQGKGIRHICSIYL